MMIAREVLFKRRPRGTPTADDFELISREIPEPGAGEVRVRNLWMSVDPYMRGQMNVTQAYSPLFELARPMRGGAIGEVTDSGDARFQKGDLVFSDLGWREGFTASVAEVRKLDLHDLPPQTFLGVAGMPGMTAYVGMMRFAGLRAGDVVYVSAAAGAVGSVACQIAKLRGHLVIGSAGGAIKQAFLEEIGVDVAIDRHAESDLTAALTFAAPDGIDVYFDNVGGDHLEAALDVLRPGGRIVLCGAISQYNEAEPSALPSNLIRAVRTKELTVRGYVSSKHEDMWPAFRQDIVEWTKSGEVKWRETVLEGLEKAPEALNALFFGANLGKMLVRLG